MTPRITVGVPVFHGEHLVSDVLDSIAAQTFQDFMVIVSVDGSDHVSADACRPYLQDRRFSCVVHDQRLGWAGNINWLARQAKTEFFVYIAQDDKVDATYYEKLVDQADQNPAASLIYSDLQWFGDKTGVISQPEITGKPADRMLSQLQHCLWLPFVGLRRTELLAKVNQLLIDQTDSTLEDVIWVTRALQIADVLCVPEALFYKRFHDGMVTVGKSKWPREYARSVWLDAWGRMLSAALNAAATRGDAEAMLLATLRRIALTAPDMDWFYDIGRLYAHERRQLIIDFVSSLKRNDGQNLSSRLDQNWNQILETALCRTLRRRPIERLDSPRRFHPDDDLIGPGWHLKEEHPLHGCFRWSGPENIAEITLPVRLDRDCRIRVHVVFSVSDPCACGFTILADQAELPTVSHAQADKTWLFEAVIRSADMSHIVVEEFVTICIRIERTIRPIDVSTNADTRALGCAVDWLELEPI